MSRAKDLTFKLPKTKTVVEVWSSDFVNFKIDNKLIKITLDNTVSDILEVVAMRSSEIGGNLNPRYMKVYFRHQEVLLFQPLSDFLEQEQHVNRLRIEINKDQLNSTSGTYIRPALLNINLKLASGKTISVREPLTATIQSLKSYIVESIGLDESHIDHFEFNGGVIIHNEEQTLGHMLDLDIAPLGELNFYVALHSDFQINLSSPVENLLRTNKIFAMLDTSVLTIKYFIVDQYTGSKTIKPDDIKIIYFGRILTDPTKLKDIIHTHTVISHLTLHFVLKEPEDPLPSQGFWSDLRRGALFEFLPREPNPNFQAEVQRDERLREQLRNGTAPSTLPNESVLVQDDDSVLNHANSENTNDETQQYINGHHHLPLEDKLTGDSLDIVRMRNGELVNVDQLDMSTTVFKISLNTIDGHKEVTLSSSQVIINDSDSLNPYLMLSPSGFAKLQKLGVEIEKPAIQIEEEPVFNITRQGELSGTSINIVNIPAPSTNQNNNNNTDQQNYQQQQQQQQQQPQWRRATIFGINSERAFQVIGSFYGIFRYIMIYVILIGSVFTSGWVNYVFISGLAIHCLTRSSNRYVLRFLRACIMSETTSNRIITRFSSFQESLKLRTMLVFKNLIELSLPDRRKPMFIQLPIDIFVSVFSFFITFIPHISRIYIDLIEERNNELRFSEATDYINDLLSGNRDTNNDQIANFLDDAADNAESDEINAIHQQDGSTGVQTHHEN